MSLAKKMKMIQPLPTHVRPVLEEYLSLAAGQLPERIRAFGLVGSFAPGEFDEHFSDIDFAAILNGKASSLDVQGLRQVHQAIERDHPKPKMSGSYIAARALGKVK